MNYKAIELMRLAASVYRFNTLGFANWYFRTADKYNLINTDLFGFVMPIAVYRSTTHRLLAIIGERLLPESKLIAPMLFKGATVIDVGANIGYYTAFFAKYVEPSGKIVCIEPESENLDELHRFINLNSVMKSMCDVVEAAAGEHGGVAKIRSGLNGRISEQLSGDQTVKVVR